MRKNLWHKYDEPDHYCNHCRNKNACCCNVFGIARIRMVVGAGEIDVKFKSGIPCFRDNNKTDCKDEREPFPFAHMKIEAEEDRHYCRQKMDPYIVLGAKHDDDAAKGVLETAGAAYQTEGLSLFCGFVKHGVSIPLQRTKKQPCQKEGLRIYFRIVVVLFILVLCAVN